MAGLFLITMICNIAYHMKASDAAGDMILLPFAVLCQSDTCLPLLDGAVVFLRFSDSGHT